MARTARLIDLGIPRGVYLPQDHWRNSPPSLTLPFPLKLGSGDITPGKFLISIIILLHSDAIDAIY
jgi:hypothetical protein